MISTHVLDTSKGMPAAGVPVRLQTQQNGAWTDVSQGVTNNDGRFSFDSPLSVGIHQIVFDVESYLKSVSKTSFYQSIPVTFKIDDTHRKYHIPLLLNPFGYSTYRGS